MKTKKLTALLLTAMLLAGLFAGCSSGNSSLPYGSDFPYVYTYGEWVIHFHGYNILTDERGNTEIILYLDSSVGEILFLNLICNYESEGEYYSASSYNLNLVFSNAKVQTKAFKYDTSALPERIVIINQGNDEKVMSFYVNEVPPAQSLLIDKG
ncbi:MAG: hypothetical protein FWG31_07775 [Oscillospiraceae bacterium]|nr:hypothetical protein [Oscillospiraceae bacterium]